MDRRRFFAITGLAALFMTSGARRAIAASGSALLPRCRVTVLRRECYSDIQGRYLDDPESGPCQRFRDGQQFIFDGTACYDTTGKPIDICPLACKCIAEHTSQLSAGRIGARCGESITDKAIITCCSDGTRPVIFKIERV